MRWKFWQHKEGIGVLRCFKCKMFIQTAHPGDNPEITKIYWDLCPRCQDKERGFIGARDKRDLAIV